MAIKKGDNVIVLTGKDKGKKGTVLKVLPKEDRVIVEGVNMTKRHMKPQRRGEKGQIVEKSVSIHISNVASTAEKKEKQKEIAAPKKTKAAKK